MHFDVDPSQQAAYATWLGVQEYGAPGTLSTFQVALFADGTVEYRYHQCSVTTVPVLVG